MYQPVCGSDGVNYSNECDLEVKACRKALQGVTLTLASRGICSGPGGGGGPSIEAQVAEEEEEDGADYGDQYDYEDNEVDECPARCTLEWDIKCGTDGKNYPNACELKRQACTEGPQNLKVAYNGKCSLVLSANIPEVPVVDESGCPECNKVFLPVCGTDGVTYNNKCKLDEAACKTGDYNLIQFLKNGPCNDGAVVFRHQIKGWPTRGFYYLYYPIFLY